MLNREEVNVKSVQQRHKSMAQPKKDPALVKA